MLRIFNKDGELEGMDLHEHGSSAYPEYVISALAAPQGMPRDTPRASMTSSATRKPQEPSGGGALADALRRASGKNGGGKTRT